MILMCAPSERVEKSRYAAIKTYFFKKMAITSYMDILHIWKLYVYTKKQAASHQANRKFREYEVIKDHDPCEVITFMFPPLLPIWHTKEGKTASLEINPTSLTT